MDQEFEIYCGKMKDELERLCGEKTRITLTKTVKNNGLVRWGFQLMAEGRNSAVILYVDDFYKDYQNGIAAANTQRRFPTSVKTMAEVMREIVSESMGEEQGEDFLGELFSVPQTCPMYVMSNSVGIYGAAVVLYDGELRRLASALGRDLIILPSSVHEVLVIPYNEELVMGDLREMVRHVNESEVPEEEVLSDNVYWYNRDTDTISIIYDRQKDVTEGSVPR